MVIISKEQFHNCLPTIHLFILPLTYQMFIGQLGIGIQKLSQFLLSSLL